jgi:hypothetical protein
MYFESFTYLLILKTIVRVKKSFTLIIIIGNIVEHSKYSLLKNNTLQSSKANYDFRVLSPHYSDTQPVSASTTETLIGFQTTKILFKFLKFQDLFDIFTFKGFSVVENISFN